MKCLELCHNDRKSGSTTCGENLKLAPCYRLAYCSIPQNCATIKKMRHLSREIVVKGRIRFDEDKINAEHIHVRASENP